MDIVDTVDTLTIQNRIYIFPGAAYLFSIKSLNHLISGTWKRKSNHSIVDLNNP